jgi:hypothetical protein
MEARPPKNRNKKNKYSLDGLIDCMRRFAQRCREADAMIRRL